MLFDKYPDFQEQTNVEMKKEKIKAFAESLGISNVKF